MLETQIKIQNKNQKLAKNKTKTSYKPSRAQPLKLDNRKESPINRRNN